MNDIKNKVNSRDRFFLTMSILFMLFLLLGFAPTFYLAPAFGNPSLPSYLYVHGIIITSWFIWFVMQSALIERKRFARHIVLGKVGIGIAILIIPGGLLATFNFLSHLTEMGVDISENAGLWSAIIWRNFGDLTFFSLFFTLAIYYRRKVNFHKRYILFASLAIVGPAVARLYQYPILNTMTDEVTFKQGLYLIMLAVILANDLIRHRRLQTATIVGVLGTLINRCTFEFLSKQEFARELIGL